MQSTERVLSLRQLNQLVASLVQRPETQNVWVTAELLDVAVRGGHCYMELLEKDERGLQVARRTVAKYRDALHIPVARYRRQSSGS